MKRWILKHLLPYLHRACDHPSDEVTADILEGSSDDAVEWCRICGAWRFVDEFSAQVFTWRLAVSPWIGFKKDLRRDARAVVDDTMGAAAVQKAIDMGQGLPRSTAEMEAAASGRSWAGQWLHKLFT